MVARMVQRNLAFSIFLLLIGLPTVRSDEADSSKRTLVNELLEVTETKKLAEQVASTVMQQMQANYSDLMVQMLSREHELTEEQLKQLQAEATESFARFSKRFRELFFQQVDFGKLTEEISVPLYEKYFTEDELKDLIAFYKTQTGQKTLRVMPQLMGESMQRTGQVLNPIMMKLVNQVMEEETARLCKEVQIC
jgi:hypothetical protein